LNTSEWRVNIAIGAQRLSRCVLAKSILILKYTNIFFIVQKGVLWRYSANANSGICPATKTSNNC